MDTSLATVRGIERTVLCLPSSPGGHFELLDALAPAYADLPHRFLMPPSPQAERLRAEGVVVERLINPRRSPIRLVPNVAQSLRLALRHRPRIVVTSGAGLAVPFSIIAKLLGAKLIFIETMARVDGASASGRILYPWSDHFLVQWKELRSCYPRAEVCRPALLEEIPQSAEAVSERRGTFVATGNHNQPFGRLLKAADEAAERGLLPQPVLAQTGPALSCRPRHMEVVPALPPGEVERLIRERAVIICHGGAGLIARCLRAGRRPLVLARRREHGEHVNDHQVAMTAKLAALGLVVSLDETPLETALDRVDEPPELELKLPGPRLVDRLAELIRAEAR